MGASRAGVQRRRVPRPEADLVPAAHDGPRLRRQAARQRPSGVRRLALARILGAARGGDRVQARGVPPGADRAASLPADGPPRAPATRAAGGLALMERIDRKSTRLNSSHSQISYAVFCLKKKKKKE